MQLYDEIIWTPYYSSNGVYIIDGLSYNGKLLDNKEYILYSIKSWIYNYLNVKYKYNKNKINIRIIKHGTSEKEPIEENSLNIKSSEFFENCDINYEFKQRDETNYLTINLYYNGNRCILPSEYNLALNKFIEDTHSDFKYFIIMNTVSTIYNDDGKLIPNKWIYPILKYIDYTLPWKINQYGLLINVSNQVDHISIITNLTSNIIKLLRIMYKNGYIVNPPERLIKNWGLSVIGKDGLYKIDKVDERITNLNKSEFLLSLIDGINYIDIRITDSYLIKYHTVLKLNKELSNLQYIMLNDKLRIYTDVMSDWIKILNIHDEVRYTSYEDTELKTLPIYNINDIDEDMKNNARSVIIPIDDKEIKYLYMEKIN